MSVKNQSAQLVLLVEARGKHAIAGRIKVVGSDIYCMTPGPSGVNGRRTNLTRLSYHETGSAIVHLGSMDLALALPAPARLKGALKIGQGGRVISPLDFDYAIKRDSARRKTLVVQASLVAKAMLVEYWAIESDNANALQDALRDDSEDYHGPPLRVVDFVMADWVSPQVAIIVRTTNADLGFG